MTEYSADKIVVRNWPKLYEGVDQKWKRAWEIRLVEEPANIVSLREAERKSSTDEIKVDIARKGRDLLVIVTTDRWGWDDDLIWYSYTILSNINDLVGEIETIQGQKRNMWRPWFQGVD